MGALAAFLADDFVRRFLFRARFAGRARRLEQFSFDDYGL
jgi:hypothetical protein